MGVSFKISSSGTRFKPKPLFPDANSRPDNSPGCSMIPSNNECNGKYEDAIGTLGSSLMSRRDHITAEDEVSFILNLYPDRYSIGKPSEDDSRLHAAFQEGSKLSLPYDRTSEGLFAAIETGRLPGGILDDIPCKYVKGAVICEICDYRKCISNTGSNTPSVTGSPTITKVRLQMSLENVVKDIPLMADDSWTYGDLMEVESRILKALQPKLCLDPTPKLDKLSENTVSIQLNLGLARMRKRRLRQMPEVTVTSSNHLHGKKVCINRVHESSSYRTGELRPSSGDVLSTLVQDNVAVPGIGNQRNIHNPMQGPTLSVPGASPSSQDMSMSYTENINSSVLGKMQSQEGQLSPYSTRNKRTRLVSGCPDGSQQQQISSYMDNLQEPDVQLRNQLLQQPQNVRGIQYGNSGMQKYPVLNGDGIGNQECVKLEKPDSSNLVKSDMQMMETESGHMDPRLQQRQIPPQSFMRPAFQQPSWTSLNQHGEKNPRKEDRFLKRKSIQSPRLSAVAMAQSPLSAKSADMSCGSMGVQYGAVSSANPLGQLQRDKSAVISFPSVERTASMTSSANDSMQPQHQAQLAANRRSNSFSKNPIMSGVGSPVSVNNMGGPMNASSPSISTPQQTEQSMIERFAKIEAVAMRHQLNCKKNKVEEYPRKPGVFSQQEASVCLSTAANNEYVKDESCTKPMSQSLVGGSMNVCKLRVLNLQPDRTPQGNMISMSPTVRMRMIMSEKPIDGTVAMHYGDLGDGDYLNAEDYLPTLPNTHTADLYAAQFSALMTKEGFFVENHIQPRPHRINVPPSSGQPSNYLPAVAHNNTAPDMKQYSETQQTADTKPTISPNPNLHPNSGIGNPHSLQALMSLKQEPVDLPHQQQHLTNPMMQHQPYFQRSSSMMLPTNSIPQLSAYGQSSNLPSGNNNINNKPSPQLLQQQQQQAPPQMQRKMMMGLGPAMGLENMGNNMVGLGGLSNVMGIGGARMGMSAPMGLGPISGMGATNMGQNPLNMSQANVISQHIRAGTLNPQAVLPQSRFLGGAQSGMAGGPRQMQPGAASGHPMLSQTLNQRNLSQIQRAMMGQMGVPKFVPGMNVPMTQQPQQQLQQQSQQEATSPLQGVVSQEMTHQQQQIPQRTPMSPPSNTRPMHPETACPASPALSSQTLGG